MDPEIASATIEPGTLLVAGVELTDGIFDGTVVLLLDVDASGALGVVLNAYTPVDLASVLPGWEGLTTWPHRLFDGGPVSQEGAICLASPTHPTEEPPGWRPLLGAGPTAGGGGPGHVAPGSRPARRRLRPRPRDAVAPRAGSSGWPTRLVVHVDPHTGTELTKDEEGDR